jgi:hypothetical protein
LAKYDTLDTARYRLTYTANNGYGLPGTLLISEGGTSTDPVAQSTHNNAGATYDYFWNTHGRDSFNNAGAQIVSSVHVQSGYNNAFWNGSQMAFGDGDGVNYGPFGISLDVVAHEFSHGVDQYSANLIYSYQSGALNESYSDVFGAMVDRDDWDLGEDVKTPGVPGDAIRSLENPGLYGQPAHMRDYYVTSGDNGGVHKNSGIPNKAAYNVAQAIGKDKMERIWYRTLTLYLGRSSQFEDACDYSVLAATDLYGASSVEVNAVKNGFAAVGLGLPDMTPPAVASTQPLPGAASVPVGGSMAAAFTEDIDPATISGSSYYLRRSSDGASVNATVDYSSSSRTAFLFTSNDLDPETSYTATITTAVTDLSGNHMSQDYQWSFTTGPPPKSYYLSWYDNNPTWGMNGDWVMISNPGSVATTVELYLGNTSGYPYPIDTFNLAPGGHVEWQAPQTTTTGPVRVVSTNGQPLVVSQRVLFRNSFNEVAAMNGDQLESKYYFSWYDSNSGFADWIMIHNPDQVNSVYYEVRVGGVVRASSTIAAGAMATPSFTSLTAGPVVVEAWTDSSKSAPANITASERVTYNGSSPSGSFSEIEGTPASRISSQYYWTTYDDVDYSDWVLVANPNASSIYYELKVAGVVRASSTIAAGEVAAPIIPGLSTGPVELRTWTNSGKTTPANSIASQRIFKAAANTFEEVPGTPVAELSSNYFWTWYDQASAGVYDWMVLVNPQTSGDIRAEVWIGGIKRDEKLLTPGVLRYAYFPGLSGGPVEIRAYRDGGLWSNPADRRSIVASHRVLWNNYFNELMGGLLN